MRHIAPTEGMGLKMYIKLSLSADLSSKSFLPAQNIKKCNAIGIVSIIKPMLTDLRGSLNNEEKAKT